MLNNNGWGCTTVVPKMIECTFTFFQKSLWINPAQNVHFNPMPTKLVQLYNKRKSHWLDAKVWLNHYYMLISFTSVSLNLNTNRNVVKLLVKKWMKHLQDHKSDKSFGGKNWKCRTIQNQNFFWAQIMLSIFKFSYWFANNIL